MRRVGMVVRVGVGGDVAVRLLVVWRVVDWSNRFVRMIGVNTTTQHQVRERSRSRKATARNERAANFRTTVRRCKLMYAAACALSFVR